MRIITGVSILLLIVGIQGCATYGRISGLPSEGQKTIFKDGRKTLISIKQNTVALAPNTETVTSGQRADFVIAINNGTSQDILFSTDDITATANTKGQLTTLKVFSYDELVAEEKNRRAWEAVAIALQGAAESMNAANAGYSNTFGTYSGSTHSNYGTKTYSSGSYSSTTYNYAAAQAARNAAQANSEARLARLEAEGRENLKNLSSTILKKETIFPAAWHGGLIKVALPEVAEQPQDIKFVVNVVGEQHEFNFTQEKLDSK